MESKIKIGIVSLSLSLPCVIVKPSILEGFGAIDEPIMRMPIPPIHGFRVIWVNDANRSKFAFFTNLVFPMKKSSLLLLSLASILGTGAVNAADNHFAGSYLVLSQEWKSASATVDGVKLKKSEAAPSIGLGYTFALDSHSTLGIKATVDTKNGEYGVGAIADGEAEVKEKSHYAIAIEPGYAINDKWLVFGILAYHRAKAQVVEEASTASAHVSGFGYGLGAKYALSHHWFMMGEVQKLDYRNKMVVDHNVKPSSTVVSLGLGYHF